MTQKVAATPASCVSILNQTGLKSWAIGKTKVHKIRNIHTTSTRVTGILAQCAADKINEVITVKCNTVHKVRCLCRYS